ncbi:pyridoxal phosphate-dependent aminotransferase [Croceicoccus mobilis]|uniref:Aminotransferase n=1 Tax=Croceicoccus mobilis TaxID=1703339 RepID=A0A916Z2G0_9SPHN|nr:pyridoxal phosphate-dependent aminotransferase [Croceicoccus mobilis]GGD71381.1 aminotransferase [Croceicoccus mobilis]
MNAQHLSQAMGRIEPSQTTAMTDRATQLREEGRDIISLSVGEPDLPTPPHVIAAITEALAKGDTRYTPVGGTSAMKRAAALHFTRDLGIAASPTGITVSAGGKQAIFHALCATIDPGDEVVIPAPWWVSYPQIARFAGATVVPLPTTPETAFRFTAAELEAAITPRTRWLLLNSPGNPTGAVFPADELLAIAGVLDRHPQVLVMSDDIYAPLRYSGAPHATLAALRPDLSNRVLTVSGVSKSHAMTGLRIGVATGPEWLIRAMEKLQSHSSGNPASISQAGAVAALEGPQDFLSDWREIFRKRRDLVCKRIAAIPGLSTPVPDGAFYCLIDAAPLIGGRLADDTVLTLHLLEHGVATVAASAFGGDHCGLAGFRISFAASEDTLTKAMDRIEAAVKAL